ncbi:MAG: aminotransferase class I/II-fold pyridoxal phosphate-dependent enzyme [Paludibaculum sp.]
MTARGRRVLRMAPYHPPSGRRAGKLRLDFNENTVGCSPTVAEYLRESDGRRCWRSIPSMKKRGRCWPSSLALRPTSYCLTNGTDEAIQVLMNTYVDDGDDVIVLTPSYAMYRFYSELAGATVREVRYRGRRPSLSRRATARGGGPEDQSNPGGESE